ncbi:MAG: hypothetical protein DHS20C11_19920 [Lysobacteraceae bacterium]|nr:MAG: hypothetical protein DHS20C11_19920 [Xanthomonadaceae bacterium]
MKPKQSTSEKKIFGILPAHWQKFHSHISDSDDLTAALLKGHLVVEEELSRLLEESVSHPPALDQARLTFQLKSLFAKALHFREDLDWLWSAIAALNRARNKLAHRLDDSAALESVDELNRLVGDVFKRQGETRLDQLKHSIAMILCLLYDIRGRGR